MDCHCFRALLMSMPVSVTLSTPELSKPTYKRNFSVLIGLHNLLLDEEKYKNKDAPKKQEKSVADKVK